MMSNNGQSWNQIKDFCTESGNKRTITVNRGAVVADHEVCSQIGCDILAEGGSAVDAAIATLLSNGVMAPHSMGIGGGCYMVIYDAQTKEKVVINGKQTAPLASNQVDFTSLSGFHGAPFISVPGEIAAYWKAHQRFGKLPWKRLFRPSIELLENGFHISQSVERALKILESTVKNLRDYKGLCEVFCDTEGNVLKEGSFVRWPKLAETYKRIAELGPEYFYKGQAAETMAKEIQQFEGIITKEDFSTYDAEESGGLEFDLGETTLLTSGVLTGGPIMGLTLNILRDMDLNMDSMKDTETKCLTFHKVIEAMKFAYGEIYKLVDADYAPKVIKEITSSKFAENLRRKIDFTRTHDISYYTNAINSIEDEGTSHISILAPNGDAVSVSSSISKYFGSLIVSESTGIIWNNGMHDFLLSHDVTATNTIKPGTRPRASMCPGIFLDKKNSSVRMVIGNAGGTKIPTTNIQVALRHLWLGQDLDFAIRAKRFHHQLSPNCLVAEVGYPQEIIEELKKYGHEIKYFTKGSYMAVVQAISRNRNTGEIIGFSDERKFPGKAIFYRTTETVYT